MARALHNPLWLAQVDSVTPLTHAQVRDALHVERIRFLQFLTQTDFPALLTWRLPALARRLFEVTGTGEVRLASHVQQDRKASKQASRVCFGYAVAALPRLAPRQAWVGQGFARLTSTSTAVNPLTQEFLHIEPDIAALSRANPALAHTPLLAGDDGWDWLARGLHSLGQQNSAVWLARARDRGCGLAVGDFQQVVQYQTYLQTQLQHWGLNSQLGQGWWASRLVHTELAVPQSYFDSAIAQAAETFFTRDTAAQTTSALPLVQRIAQSYPECVLAQADEFWNWLIARHAPVRPRLAQNQQQVKHSALMLMLSNQQLRVLGFDPSPLRSASRVLRLLGKTVAFTADQVYYPLAIAENVLDNRVIRPACAEYLAQSLPMTAETEVRTTLMNTAIWQLFLRELASPRYAVAPDILPLYADFTAETVFAYGHLSVSGDCLLLFPHLLPALCKNVKHGLGLAKWLKELNPRFLTVLWLDVLLAGKQSCIYTACGLGFDWLFTQLANVTYQQAVVIRIPTDTMIKSPLIDAQGNALDAMFMLKGLYP